MILGCLALGLWRERKNFSWYEPAGLCLASALFVFGIGTLLGLFVDGEDTRTPAHYHGVISGINLIFIGIFYVWFLPILARAPKTGKFLSFQIILYAVGQLIFISGMFAAGGMGASRKIMGAGIDIDNFSAILVTSIRDLGGALSIIGGILFIIIVFNSLFRYDNTVS
jgi:heme/copper-type cytochrome/quinol oxidase subunit 1